MAKKLPKIELTLLKKLVSELENTVNTVQKLPLENKEQVDNFIIELAKASGLAASVAQEASALTKDMYSVATMAQQPDMPVGDDLLSELFGSIKVNDPEKKNRN